MCVLCILLNAMLSKCRVQGILLVAASSNVEQQISCLLQDHETLWLLPVFAQQLPQDILVMLVYVFIIQLRASRVRSSPDAKGVLFEDIPVMS